MRQFSSGTLRCQASAVASQVMSGSGGWSGSGVLGQLQHEVVVVALVDGDVAGDQLFLAVGRSRGSRVACSRPSPVQRTRPAAPDPVVTAEPARAVAAESGARLQQHPHASRPAAAHDAAQQHHLVGVAGKGQGLAAFHGAIVRDPAAVPDQGVRLVEAAPHVPHVGRGDGVHPAAADETGEDGVGIPARRAHPGDLALRADQRAALTVGEQRVLAQHPRREGRLEVDGLVSHRRAPPPRCRLRRSPRC